MKKPKSRHISIRMPADIADAVAEIAERTGWSEGKSACWLIATGVKDIKTPDSHSRQMLEVFTKQHTIEVNAASQVATARARTRAALAKVSGGGAK